MYKISLLNLKRNYRNYVEFFISTTIIFMLYGTLNIFASDQLIIGVLTENASMAAMAKVISIFFIIFIMFYIYYFGQFFNKNRFEDLSIYSMLGYSQQQIGLLLFFEDLLILSSSFVLGVLLAPLCYFILRIGIISSLQLTLTFGYKLEFNYIFKTILILLCMLMSMGISIVLFLQRNSLVELQKVKIIPNKTIKQRPLRAILGGVFLLVAYYLTFDLTKMPDSLWTRIGYYPMMLLIIILVTVGVWLFIKYSFNTTLQIWQKRNSNYRNSIIIPRTKLRIIEKSRLLIVLSLLISLIIAALCTIFFIINYQKISLKAEIPSSFEIKTQQSNSTIDKLSTKYASKTTQLKLLVVPSNKKIPITKNKQVDDFEVVKITDYNKLLHQQGKKELAQLPIEQGYLISIYPSQVLSKKNQTYQLEGHNLRIKTIAANSSGISFVNSNAVLVVNDALYNQLQGIRSYYITTINDKNLENDKKIRQLIKQFKGLSYYDAVEKTTRANSATLIMISFIAVLFFVSTGCILYFVIVTDNLNNLDENLFLYQLGFTIKDFKYLFYKETGLLFIVPLSIGFLNGLVAFITLRYVTVPSVGNTILGSNKITVIPIIYALVIFLSIYSTIYFYTNKKINKLLIKKLENKDICY